MNIEVKKDLQRYTVFLLYWAAVILIAILLSASGSGGGMSKSVIAVLTKGTQVEELYRGNYWTQIQYKNIVGWINNAYIK